MRLLVLFLLAASATAAPGPLFGGIDEAPPETEAASDPIELPDELPADVAAEARRILERTFRVTWTVARFTALPTEVVAVLERPILDAAGQKIVREAALSGALRVERIAGVSGRTGEVLAATSGERRDVVPMREGDSAQEAVVIYPVTGYVRSGLRASVRLGVVAGRGVRVAYDLVLTDDPVVETVDDTGGEVDRVALPEIRARGALRLAPDEVAPIRFEDADGAGVLVLLRLDGPDEDLPALIGRASGVTLAVGGHLADGTSLDSTWGLDDDWEVDEEQVPDPSLDARWEDLLAIVDDPEHWWDLPGGLRAGLLDPSIREALDETLAAGAALRGRREVLVVRRTGRDRVRLPMGPGETFELFRGVRRSVRGGTEVWSGCPCSSVAEAMVAVTEEGFGIVGRAGVDGTVDLALAARDVLASESRVFSMKRVIAGYRGLESIPVRLPLVTDAIVRVRGALSAGGGSLPGGVHVTWIAGDTDAVSVPEQTAFEDVDLGRPVGGRGFLPARRDARVLRRRLRPVSLEVGGQPLAMRPNSRGRLVDIRRRARVTSRESDGHCGMRIRHPVRSHRPDWTEDEDGDGPRQPHEGTRLWLGLFPRPDGLAIDAEGEIGGPPAEPVAFDPGDGPVEIVRHPRLVFTVEELLLGGGGVVAQGAGLTLEIRRPGVPPGFGPHLRAVCRRPDGETLLRTGTGGSVDAGGITLLPTVINGYASNHEMGEAATGFSWIRDGVRLAWSEEDEAETPMLSLEILAPPQWRGIPVRTVLAPARPGNELRTLSIGRRTTRRLFYPEPGRGLGAASAAGSPLTWEVEAGGDS